MELKIRDTENISMCLLLVFLQLNSNCHFWFYREAGVIIFEYGGGKYMAFSMAGVFCSMGNVVCRI
ncbi:hypothetical protein [Yersinia pekkanenii]|uniref:hypothetical protein n=1 Tax=Yersinia pekkanenii TaxID=1288385 RepID=UPI00066FC92C|nr:hypothetical protein [Yersinia pekkanenii]